MTPDERLDRLERVAKLLANAGMRARRDLRRDVWNHDHKINYLANLQIANEERFAELANFQTANEERFAELANFQTANEERFAKLTESQAHTNQRLDELIDIIRDGRNGGSSRNN